MRESFVSFSHTVRIFFLFESCAFTFAAATISLTSLSAIVLPFLSRLYLISHFMFNRNFLSVRTSVGIWKVAPPILRLRTSTEGVTLPNAFSKLHNHHPRYFAHLVNCVVENDDSCTFLALPHNVVYKTCYQFIVETGIRC